MKASNCSIKLLYSIHMLMCDIMSTVLCSDSRETVLVVARNFDPNFQPESMSSRLEIHRLEAERCRPVTPEDSHLSSSVASL